MQKIDLICKVQQGDVQAQGQLYEQYWEKLYRLAYAITKNKEDSMDIVQDSFISAFAHINNLRNINAFDAWIFQIVRNNAKKHLNMRKNMVDLHDDENEKEDYLNNMPDADEAIMPESVLDNQVKRELVMQTINELSDEQRACILLFYYDGISIKDIASIQECSEGTVKSRLNYARKKIRDRIEEIEQDSDIRLHSLMPLGVLLSQITIQMPDSTQIEQMWNAIKGGAGIAGTIGAAGAAGTAGSSAAKGGLLATLKAKIIAGVTAATVVTGGVVIANLPEPIQFNDPAMEQNIRVLLDKPTGNLYEDDVEKISDLIIMDQGLGMVQKDESIAAMPETEPVSTLSDLEKLPNLQTLILKVENPQPLLDSLGNLPNLSYLSARDGGQIQDLSFLQDLPAMQTMIAEVSNSIDLSPVEQATSLRYAYILGAGHLQLDLTELQNLAFLSIRSLAAGGEYDTLSLTASKDLPNLKMLEIDTDSLENLDVLYHTPALEFFQIGETDRVDDGISTIATLQQLRYLSIGGGGYDFGPLANCASLEVIAVMNNSLENMPTNVKLIDTKQGFEPINNIREEMEEKIGFIRS